MKLMTSLTSLARGALWLLRAGGLREQLRQVQHLQSMHHWWQSGDLRSFEQQVYSQNGEDGIIKEILRRIGVKHRFFVEFGVEDGKECNCARLVREENWAGVFLEAAPEKWQKLREYYGPWSQVHCQQTAVSSRNIETLLAAHQVPNDFDVLSIDIDGNDYWVWKAIERWQPRLVVIEYNAAYPPPVRWVIQENLEHRWDHTNYYGASLTSLVLLGRQKGYTLVASDSRGVNAFFVRSELATPDLFLDTALHYHYSPFKHPNCPNGHPQGHGPYVEI
jgi:Methyltransferase FkbM domain